MPACSRASYYFFSLALSALLAICSQAERSWVDEAQGLALAGSVDDAEFSGLQEK